MAATEDGLIDLAGEVGALLLQHELRLATAESCTGGWIAKVLTDVPGSSRWFERGFVVYSNAAKMEMLGVSQRTLEHSGAVSRPVAIEMARGAVTNRKAQIGVAVTGIAGPDGGTSQKPVGLIWLAWYRSGGMLASRHEHFRGERVAIRRQAVVSALRGLLEFVG